MAEKLLKTDIVKNAERRGSAYRMADGGGLSLLVQPNGSKLFQYIYKFDGKSKTMSLGQYPDVLLSDARRLHQEARRLKALGQDPLAVEQASKAAQLAVRKGETSFAGVAKKWHGKWKPGVSAKHAERTWSRLENWVFPTLGKKGIADIRTPDLVRVLTAIEASGNLSVAHTARINISQVFSYAVQSAIIDLAPSTMLKGVLRPERVRHFPSITNPGLVSDLVRKIENYSGSPVTKAALWLALLTFQRPSQIRFAKRSQIDWEDGMWSCSPDMMKGSLYDKEYGGTHLVPLPWQALKILKDLEGLTGPVDHLFPSVKKGTKVMSAETINKALRSMGYAKRLTGHGFRAMARTMLAQQLRVSPKYMEHQLDHKVKDPLGNAYDRAEWEDERKDMMQLWADYLFELAKNTDETALKGIAERYKKSHDLRD